jgi:pyrimidine operon attenuation protein/uracil phosphoribosyltransferase
MADTDSRQLIAAELRSLIARIEISMRLIDAAMTSDDLEAEDDSAISSADLGSTEIVVLDDITPRYATASAALNTCRAELGHALQQLSEPGSPV